MFKPLHAPAITIALLGIAASASADDSDARVIIVNDDEMGAEYRLERLEYAIDGSPMLEVEAKAHGQTSLIDAKVASGPHKLRIRAMFRGNGYGPMSRQRALKFRSESSFEFIAHAGHSTKVRAVWHEEGSVFTPLEDRLAIRYEQSSVYDASLVPKRAAPEPTAIAAALDEPESALAIPEAQLAEPEPSVEPEVVEPVVVVPEQKVEAFAAEAPMPPPELETVYFGSGKAALRRKARRELRELAKLMTQDGALTVDVIGHTDSRGSTAFNLRLSQRRADAVVRYLVRRGVDRERLTSLGKGEEEPSKSNASVAGRAKNRRTEFHVSRQARSS